MTLENLVGKGLRHESASLDEIQRLLTKANTRLEDAANPSVSRDSRIESALQYAEFCIASVWSTPKNDENHARQIRRIVDNCTAAKSDGDADENV